MNDNRFEYEYEVDLKDLCVSMLRKWRQILIAMVIGAVLLGAVRVVINLNSEPEVVVTVNEDQTETEETVPVSVTNKLATFIVLGAVCGAFVVCAYAFLRYCFDKTIHLEEDLSRYTGLQVLASVDFTPEEEGHKKNVIDRLLDRLAGINYEADCSLDTQCAIAAAKIQLLSSTKSILVTGTVNKKVIRKIGVNLRKLLPEEEYEVVMGENPMINPEEIIRLNDYELVLVEAPHATKVKELLSLNSFLKLGQVKVLGIVSTAGWSQN
ncbi:MAG: hypothetical protein LUI10_02215 [Lachnospiraceae bacterium]|nr:hypothetical protein [Lachnospiraceae bacterium]